MHRSFENRNGRTGFLGLAASLAIHLGLLGPVFCREKEGPASSASELFDSQAVLELSLEIPEAGVEALRNDQRAYVAATLRESGTTWRNVGLRVKGSAGSYRPVDSDKPGFTIKVNQYDPTLRFHGLRKFLLNNAAQDPSYFSELLGNELFRAAGVPAARAGFARVSLNGRDMGLFVLIESVSRDFLSRHFENPFGNLYEGPGDVDGEMDSDSHGHFLDREDLMMLSHAADERDPRERMRRLREVLDVERFLSFLAMEAVTWHWDGYGVGVNNYRIYDDPSTGRMVFLPHGSDQLFQDPNGTLVPQLQGVVAVAVLTTREGQMLYRKRLESIQATILDPAAIRRRVAALQARVRPVLEKRGADEAREHENAVASFLEHVLQRFQSVSDQLSDGAGLFGAPLEFDAQGVARLKGWKPKVDRGNPELTLVEEAAKDGTNGQGLLLIRVGDEGSCVASWRTKVVLAPGRYRFIGQLRAENVEALEDDGEGGRPSGASLRVSGQHPRTGPILGTSSWSRFEFDFRVGAEGARMESGEAGVVGLEVVPAAPGDVDAGVPPQLQVQLVCELRARKGAVWFQLDSLRLVERR